MTDTSNDFGKFEHTGWQRVAEEFENTWGSLTKLFIPALLERANINSKTRLLDVACGPGFVAEAAHQMGAEVIGLDFSSEMVALAKQLRPHIEFLEGDAQDLKFEEASFDTVVMNFGVLHLPSPPAAFREARRVLREGGRYVFSSWAHPDVSPGAKIVEDAVGAHANTVVDLPQGPDFFTYTNADDVRSILAETGFDGTSMQFDTVTVNWQVPSASYLYELERDHGVRTAAVLAAQDATTLDAIQSQIENDVQAFASGDGYLLPYAAHIIAVTA